MHVIVTGCAGFIGHHLSIRLLDKGWEVVGIDNLDPYYDVRIKMNNLDKIIKNTAFEFFEKDVNDMKKFENDLAHKADIIVHLAAKAGVQPSFRSPVEFARANINGTLELLDYARRNDIRQIIFASSSSVYGLTENTPFSEEDTTICPISPYGMTKYHAENFCKLYTELYGLEINALRFFTVYGPGQRPDMAINKFICSIMNGREIKMFGSGEMDRDYTYIDDIIDGILNSMDHFKGYKVFNLGSGKPIKLKDMIETIGEILEIEPNIKVEPIPPGEMSGTFADISKANEFFGYAPKTNFREGVAKEIEWLKENRNLML